MLKKTKLPLLKLIRETTFLFMILFLITIYNNSKSENVVCNTCTSICNYMHIIDHFTLQYYSIKAILLKNKNQICRIRICHNII